MSDQIEIRGSSKWSFDLKTLIIVCVFLVTAGINYATTSASIAESGRRLTILESTTMSKTEYDIRREDMDSRLSRMEKLLNEIQADLLVRGITPRR